MKIKFKNIETERLLLRKFTVKDLDDFIEFQSDPSMYNFQPSAAKESREKYLEDLNRFISFYSAEPLKAWPFAVVNKENHKVIGKITVSLVDDEHCRMSCAIHKDYRQNGLAFEACKAIIDFLKENNMDKININIWSGNKASINLATKLGFKLTSVEKDARQKDGKIFDNLNFSL